MDFLGVSGVLAGLILFAMFVCKWLANGLQTTWGLIIKVERYVLLFKGSSNGTDGVRYSQG